MIESLITPLATTTGMPDFMMRALVVTIVLGLAAAPVGCLLIWRRMNFISDTIAHSALFGFALGAILGLEATWVIIALAIFVGYWIAPLGAKSRLSADTMLPIFSYAFLALGVIMIAAIPSLRQDPASFLFGDILTITPSDIMVSLVLATGVLLFIGLTWSRLVLMTLNEDMALAEGIWVRPLSQVFTFITACLVALSLKVLGILLAPGFLLIPAATARLFSRTPKGMAVGALVIAWLGTGLGFIASWHYNWPTGAAVTMAFVVLFSGAHLVGSLRRGT